MAIGTASKQKHEQQQQSKQALWQLGLPKKQPSHGAPPLTQRPSLVNVPEAIANMRKAMGSV